MLPSCSRAFSGRLAVQFPVLALPINRGIKHIPKPETFENVIFPPEGGGPLKPVSKVPTFNPDLGEEERKVTKRQIEFRGPEQVHTSLWHKQFGIVALTGGFLRFEHFELMQKIVNRHMNPKRFAVWRVEEPWLPRTKKRQGSRGGGGKGNIHHYATPVRAGRVILEVGGHITMVEAQTFLPDIAHKLPMEAIFVTEEDMAKRELFFEKVKNDNVNPYNWDFILRWNMQNCSAWLSPYEFVWKGKFRC